MLAGDVGSAVAGQTAVSHSVATDVVFVDGAVNEYEALLADVPQTVEIILLSPDHDPIDQISDALQGRQGIKSLHFISHGEQGRLQLAGRTVDLEVIQDRKSEIGQWGRALTSDADILLYGCNVASGSAGDLFVRQLAKATNADVAASTDVTGSETNANWILETAVGAVHTPLIVSANAQDKYLGTLGIEIYAAGETGREKMELQIDGETVQSWSRIGGDADQGLFKKYTYDGPSDVSGDRVRVVFTNDKYKEGVVDRNLYVDKIVIDGREIQTESEHVLSNATWQSGIGFALGNWESEALHGNGYFQFNENSANHTIAIHAAGATGTETMQLLIDGEIVNEWQNVQGNPETREFHAFYHHTDEAVAAHRIRVQFANDLYEEGFDRNLVVDDVIVGGIQYEMESDSVLSTGTWKAEDEVVSGYRQSEWLHANGFFQLEYDAESDVVLQWNDFLNDMFVANETQQNPGYASRTMAMMNVAMYDAVTLTLGDASDAYFDYDQEAIWLGENASAEIVASQAAYTVLSELYPEQQGSIDNFYNQVMESHQADSRWNTSVWLGDIIGSAMVDARSDDGSAAVFDYNYKDGLGKFKADPLNPDVPVWGPGWQYVDTFAVSSAEDYAPISPPDISSEQYAVSYNEVKMLGSVDSEARTAEQTEIGIFWAYDRAGLGTPMALFNDALRSISIQQHNTLEQNAALHAQASVALADAGVVAWHTKFTEEFWRPVTAIHQGDHDGNDLTHGDEYWTAIGAPDGEGDIVGFTPQFPTYISGHATFGAAVFGAIEQFYGTDDISFDLTSRELEILLDDPDLMDAYGLDLDDATRTFDSLSEAAAENGRSRVYLGIHFDFDDLIGQEVGYAVAEAVSSGFVVASA